MDTVKLFELIDRLTPEYIQFWKDICSIETRSDKIDDLNRLGDLMSDFAEAHGLKTIREHYEGAGDPLVFILPEKKAEDGSSVHGTFSQEDGAVSFFGHFDTVHETGVFGDPPVREKDGMLYGPGVYDMKGGVAIAFLVTEAIRQSGLPHREIRLVLDPDEESGEHLNEHRKEFHLRHAEGSVAVINFESGVANMLTVGRKGVLRVAIDVTGVPGHAGNFYFESSSAIREAANKIVRIEACSEKGGLTYNVGKIEGGNVVNIVPEHCHMELDIRFPNEEKLQEAYRTVEKVTKEITVPGCTATWRQLHLLEAMTETEGNDRLFRLIADTAAENGLEELNPIVRGGGSDAAFPVLLGIPVVDSAGVVGRYEHTTREEADMASFPRRAKIITASVLKI